MLFEKVNFTKFSIDPREIMRSLPQYQPACWPLDWDIVCIPNGDLANIMKWAMEYTQSAYDVCSDPSSGTVLVAFEDLTESVLFKISYTEKTHVFK